MFKISHQSGKGRRGLLATAHGEVSTPAFMPVGTVGAVKAITPSRVQEIGTEMILANSYHLMLRPGAERIARLGGLHKFMGWSRAILTDSGGFQIMSLASKVEIEESGALFQSHIDGSRYRLTPERAMEVQALLGSDIHMVLDECLRLPVSDQKLRQSVDLSLRWAERSKAAAKDGAKVFGIVQGGVSEEARVYSAQRTVEIGFDGYALGGLSVGEKQSEMLAMLDATLSWLPIDRPRYLMGVGRPDDLVLAIGLGVDMFDCVLPTREARHGRAYTSAGALNLRNAKFAEDHRPLEEGALWSRAYLHHLFNINEPLGMMILTEHNLCYFQKLMAESRAAITSGCFEDFQNSVLAIYGQS